MAGGNAWLDAKQKMQRKNERVLQESMKIFVRNM
jgi:hypothetical protein